MQLPLPDLLRQSIYSRVAGYEDLNDADSLVLLPLPANQPADGNAGKPNR